MPMGSETRSQTWRSRLIVNRSCIYFLFMFLLEFPVSCCTILALRTAREKGGEVEK